MSQCYYLKRTITYLDLFLVQTLPHCFGGIFAILVFELLRVQVPKRYPLGLYDELAVLTHLGVADTLVGLICWFRSGLPAGLPRPFGWGTPFSLSA